MTPTRSASEGVNSLPRLRFGLVWKVPFSTAGSIKLEREAEPRRQCVPRLCLGTRKQQEIVSMGQWQQAAIAGKTADIFWPSQRSPGNHAVLFLHGHGRITLKDNSVYTSHLERLG